MATATSLLQSNPHDSAVLLVLCLKSGAGHSLQVLFTITKEKLNNSWKYAMTVLLLDVLQVLAHDSAWN